MVTLGGLLFGVLLGSVVTLIVCRTTVRELRHLLRLGQDTREAAEKYRAAAESYYQMAKAHDANAGEARAEAVAARDRMKEHERNAEEMLDRARALHGEMLS